MSRLYVGVACLIVGGVSVAFLFDVSGSMEGRMPDAREAATHVLNWLDAERDEAAVFTFDTQLDERAPFTVGLKALPRSIERCTSSPRP